MRKKEREMEKTKEKQREAQCKYYKQTINTGYKN